MERMFATLIGLENSLLFKKSQPLIKINISLLSLYGIDTTTH